VSLGTIGGIEQFPFVVVGSGFYGLTVAEQISGRLNLPVLVLEKRSHIGGNAYSYFDSETGIEIHKYGTHIFHTSNSKVWEYVNRFTTFNGYIHKVRITSNSKVYSMPINLHSINQFLGTSYSPLEAENWVKSQVLPLGENEVDINLEQKGHALIGPILFDNFIRGYTQKQWQLDPRLLPGDIISRLPVRYNYDDKYFDDVYQGIPTHGYANWINNMIKNPKIVIIRGVDFFYVKSQILKSQKIIYTGPIDKYFNYSHGHLSWRTLDFEIEKKALKDFQGISVMNYADLSIPYTRIHEFRHLHPEREYPNSQTVIMKEFSKKSEPNDEPYYPINSQQDKKILERYREMQKTEVNTTFGGRLGRYQYLDMHMAIGSALQTAEELISRYKASNYGP
jgi:UDP-galactopyranose mutase